MIVTINTDASWSQFAKRGSFAYWMVCNEFKLRGSGMLKNTIDQVYEAEFQCILNALHVLRKQNVSHKIRKIIINTDCMTVIYAITKNKDIELVGIFNDIKKLHFPNTEIEVRHVKAHAGTDTKRQFVNNWCDRQARIQMGLFMRAEKKKQDKIKS